MSKGLHKIGFWSVFSIVISSQIGSGILMLPSNLAPFGMYGFIGWIISGFGAIALSLIFAILCAHFPKTGGPHVYAGEAFGSTCAFFTGWTYWVISWVSTSAVAIASIGYLSPFLSGYGQYANLTCELLLVIVLTWLNLRGIEASGHAEFILTILKIAPLIILPIIALYFFDPSNIEISELVSSSMKPHEILEQTTLLTLWGFIGLECATAPAEFVKNPKKTIPLAIVSGTAFVAFIYIINCLGIMGIIPSDQLAMSDAPYFEATQYLFGGNWSLLISVISSIICVGALNAWILTSGQIALGLAQDKLMPKIFLSKNKNLAPSAGIMISSIGTMALIILTQSDSIASQIKDIIDISVISFLFVYVTCSISFTKIFIKNKLYLMVAFIALSFCSWIIYETPGKTLIVSSLFTLSGLPIYFLCKRNKPN